MQMSCTHSQCITGAAAQVGGYGRLGRKQPRVSERTAAAAHSLRCKVAADKEWRITLKKCFDPTKESLVAAYAGMVLTALLDDEEARPKVLITDKAVHALLRAVLLGLEHDNKVGGT